MNLSASNIHSSISDLLNQTDQIARESFGKVKAEYKGGSGITTDILTQTDKEIESFLQSHLDSEFPEIGFIGEEGEYHTNVEYNWVIDPIDGTLNFSRGIPIFGTVVALWHQAEPIYVQLSFPLLHERVWAGKSLGIHFNDEKIDNIKFNSRSPVVLYQHVSTGDEQLQVLDRILSKNLPLPIRVGAASYSLALVATGRADLAILLNQAIWDSGHGSLLAQEAQLEYHHLSKPITLKNLLQKGYNHSALIGQKVLVKKVSEALPILT